MDLEKIKHYAFKKHKEVNQKYGDKEYSYHLEGVVNTIKEFQKEHTSLERLIAGAYLHDILEDTKGTAEEILEISNIMVLGIVKRLTDKDGKNRKERHLNTYYLIRESQSAVIVKLADRIFNIRESISNKEKLKMYLKEKDSFKFALFDPRHIHCSKMWEEYDELIKKSKGLVHGK